MKARPNKGRPQKSPGPPKRSSREWVKPALWLGLPFVLGAGLRTHLLGDQILTDSEWHALYFTITTPFSYLAFHAAPNAACIPMNLYDRFLLDTVGWSEVSLRMPHLSAGLLGLALFPVLLSRCTGGRLRPAVLFAFLFAISPVLIVHSRLCRPYSVQAALAFASILSAHLWLSEGSRSFRWIHAVTAVLAVYWNPFSAFAVLSPAVLACLVKAAAGGRIKTVPGLREILLTGLVICGGIVLLVLPAAPDLSKALRPMIGSGTVSLEMVKDLARLISGTPHALMACIFSLFAVLGAASLLRQIPLFGILVTGGGILTAIGFGILRIRLDDPLGLTGNGAVLLPLTILPAAAGIDVVLRFAEKARRPAAILCHIAAALFVSILFWSGPFRTVHRSPNNFTNHLAYQKFHAPFNWETYLTDFGADILGRGTQTAAFYESLEKDPESFTILEYPMVIGDHFNDNFYHQHFHRKKIVAGYMTGLDVESLTRTASHVYGDWPVDVVFSRRFYDTRKLAFRNMVDVLDVRAVRSTGARYLIVHKVLRGEAYGPSLFLISHWHAHFGKPAYEDSMIAVYRLST